jgi:hypothetical protein
MRVPGRYRIELFRNVNGPDHAPSGAGSELTRPPAD